jgi:hypothetical protein
MSAFPGGRSTASSKSAICTLRMVSSSNALEVLLFGRRRSILFPNAGFNQAQPASVLYPKNLPILIRYLLFFSVKYQPRKT